MFNIRIVVLSVVLVLILALTARLVTARTEVVSNPSSDSASALNNQEQSANQNKAPISSYRSPLDECFDVPLSEAAVCRSTSQTSGKSYQSPLDECFDVSISEIASCRNASQAPAP